MFAIEPVLQPHPRLGGWRRGRQAKAVEPCAKDV
jgi:hypothetical protein